MNNKYALFLSCAFLTLTGCAVAKEELGMTRHSPDEFAIIKRAPLDIPEGRYTLPKPQPGAQRPQEQPAVEQARETVLGAPKAKNTQTSTAENILLKKTNAQTTNPDIRATVNQETRSLENHERPVIDRLLSLGGKKQEPHASIVDAPAELERLKKNKEEGKSVVDGETPTINN